jgi:predicted RNA-binding Zn ribbon-like protein
VVNSMDDRKVFERAFDAIDRLKNLKPEPLGDTGEPDAMQKWKPMRLGPEPPLRKKLDMRLEDSEGSAWHERADPKNRALLAHDAVRMEALRPAFAELRELINADLTDEIARLNCELSDLREAIAELRAMIAARNVVLDLPSSLHAP